MRISISFIVAVIFSTTAIGQQAYQFKKGLIVNANSRYGREALYTDPLAYKLYSNTLPTPVAGAPLNDGDTSSQSRWQDIETDSLGRFISRTMSRAMLFRGGSYLYLTYTADAARAALLNVQGAAGFYFNGEPHTADPYRSGWLEIPVQLKKGINEIYVRGAFVQASLRFPEKPVLLNVSDSTLPHIVVGQSADRLQGAVVVINTTSKNLMGLRIRSMIEGKEVTTAIPNIPAASIRKVPFSFNTQGVTAKGKYTCKLELIDRSNNIDAKELTIEAVDKSEQYSNTFVSNIDGSLQYYAVTPQAGNSDKAALFLSVHGAGVEAIGQARAYKPKGWGNLVAATNRRPRGFNWEDWGRLDALEVLSIATNHFKPDPSKIYLTGHSMGGHGTWFLGATYPDKWAAIAPCAGYPTLKGYGSADGLIPDSAGNSLEQLLLRTSNQSDVVKLANNYKNYGVYIFHGDSDKVVSVNYARQMKKILADFHKDMSYYEYPGGEHWFGDISVDWPPIFDYFKWHSRPVDSAMDHLEFISASPGISADYYWSSILQQHFPLKYSTIDIRRNRRDGTVSGTTENVRLLKLKLGEFAGSSTIRIALDSSEAISYTLRSDNDSVVLLREADKWTLAKAPSMSEKGPHRYGTFKDAFNHNMVFVYGTTGTKEENEWSLQKARLDAETWYYRGNGAIDIIADKEYSLSKYKDRGVILFGNENTNAAWKILLKDCPIHVKRNAVEVSDHKLQGDDLAAYFVWPIQSSAIASVGVIAGSGLKGMKAANANQYFAGASGFPDFMIYSLDMLVKGASEVKIAGFYDHNWKIDKKNMEVNQ